MSVDLEPTSAARPARSRRRTVGWFVGTVLGLLVVSVLLRDQLPGLSEIGQALTTVDPWWVALAVLLTALQLTLVAHQQRVLLAAFGVPIRRRRIQAVTYGGAALSAVLPAGGAVAGGWTYREFRRVGAPSGVAGTVTVLSGLLAALGLGLTALMVPVLSWLGSDSVVSVAVAAGIVGAVGVLLAAASRWPGRSVPAEASTPRLDRWALRRPRLAGVGRAVVGAVRRTAGLDGRTLRAAIVASAGKWLCDAAALWASCRAVGLDPDPWAVGALYLGVQVVRQIPLTPGGVGLVEAALLAGLTAAGAAAAPATVAVLVYRVVGTWAVAAVGTVCLAVLSRAATPEHPGSPLPVQRSG